MGNPRKRPSREVMLGFLSKQRTVKQALTDISQMEDNELYSVIFPRYKTEFNEYCMHEHDHVVSTSSNYTKLTEPSIKNFCGQDTFYVGFYSSSNILGHVKKLLLLKVFKDNTCVLISGIHNPAKLNDTIFGESYSSLINSLHKHETMTDDLALQLRHGQYIAYRGPAFLVDGSLILNLQSIPHAKRPNAVQDSATIVISIRDSLVDKENQKFLGGAALGLFNSTLNADLRPILFIKHDGAENSALISNTFELLSQDNNRPHTLKKFLEPLGPRHASKLSAIQSTWIEFIKSPQTGTTNGTFKYSHMR